MQEDGCGEVWLGASHDVGNLRRYTDGVGGLNLMAISQRM
jgi:hypothetical protein